MSDSVENNDEATKKMFKSKKRKNLRQRIKTEESDDEDVVDIRFVVLM